MTEMTINNRDALLRDINDAMPLRKIADALDRMSLSADTKALPCLRGSARTGFRDTSPRSISK